MPAPSNWKPKVFVSKTKRLRIVDPDNPPQHSPKGEAIWGTVCVFDNGVYIPKDRNEEKMLLKHKGFNKDYHVQDEMPASMQGEQVVGMVTISKPETVLSAEEIKR